MGDFREREREGGIMIHYLKPLKTLQGWHCHAKPKGPSGLFFTSGGNPDDQDVL